jgi:hypothetical protein
MLTKKRKDIFFIVIDTTNSIIDEHEILDTFHGSSSLTIVTDNKTGDIVDEYPSRQKDSLHHINKGTDILSGVIYFKQELKLDNKYEPHIILKGNIFQNPYAINKLSETEINKLKEIIFDR